MYVDVEVRKRRGEERKIDCALLENSLYLLNSKLETRNSRAYKGGKGKTSLSSNQVNAF